jgi:hypothetical protein
MKYNKQERVKNLFIPIVKFEPGYSISAFIKGASSDDYLNYIYSLIKLLTF